MTRRRDKAIPIAFLSSMTWQFEPATPDIGLRSLRKHAWQENQHNLWVAEFDEPQLGGKPPMEIMDSLLRKVRQSEVFICLLGGKRHDENEHGSRIEFAEWKSAVSYFETELFMAALLEKQIVVFVSRDFDPAPRLSSLLDLLEFAMPKAQWCTGLYDTDILKGIDATIRQALRRQRLPRWEIRRQRKTIRSRMIAKKYRLAIGDGRPHGDRPILFLGGAGAYQSVPPDRGRIRQLLDEEQTMADADAKLGRLWMAIRELMARPPESNQSTDFLELWNLALTRWSAAAGWCGLHGHIDLSFAAAGYSMARVRQRMRDRSTADIPQKMIEYPGGGIASALFSTAKWMPSRAERDDVLADGWVHLQRCVAERPTINSGLAHMLGSYCLALRHTSEGVDYFERALSLAESEKINLGVSHSELGDAYLRQGQMRKGLDHLNKGAALLEQFGGGNSGEYCRALRKLATGYAISGRLPSAIKTRKLLRPIALARGYYDQYR